MSEVGRWLENLKLGKYTSAFEDNDVDLETLPDLTEHDLAGLGVSMGHRKKLLRAIAALTDYAAGTVTQANDRLPSAPTTGPVAERRQLTVMFCDLVGFTALSQQLDPEDLRETISAYREVCAREISRFDGFIAAYVGDGIVVYFGYPQTHEDEAERAVRSALNIVEAVVELRENSRAVHAEDLAVRIGIATGLVVVGDVVGEGTTEHDSALGETPNLAARLQTIAEPNSVVISASTKDILGELLEYEYLGKHKLKGISEPVRAWRAIRPHAAKSRFEASGGARLTPMVGREEETQLLARRWEQAEEGEGQVLLLSGEPGIGKSRMLRTLRERAKSGPHIHLDFQCSAYYSSSAFYPFIEQFERAAELDRQSTPERRLQKLEAILTPTTQVMEEVAPLFAALLSIPTGDRYPPLEISPQRQKDDTVAALVDRFIELSKKKPVLILFEDAQWIDPTSNEVLELLVDQIQYWPILLVVTYRPDFRPVWQAHLNITTLALNKLSRGQRVDMVKGVTRGKTLPDEVLEQIVEKTDGVPLFVEELTKAVLESHLLVERNGGFVLTAPLHNLAIPATLTDSLMARLDRLSSFKEVAQIGATIGRQFSYELLLSIAGMEEESINEALAHLETAGLIVRRGHPPDSSYKFKHALVQDVSYSSLLKSKRYSIHARIVSLLEHRFPDLVRNEPELLAHHCTEAKLGERAVDYWLAAGRRAMKGRANQEAITHVRRGLELLSEHPDIPDHDRKELDLRILLGIPLIAAKGYAAADVEKHYSRARDLGEQLGDMPKAFAATRGLWVHYFIRAELDKARKLADQLLASATNEWQNGKCQTGYLIEARRALGMNMLYLGNFEASRENLKRGLALYDPEQHQSLAELHGIDPGIVCLSYLGYVSWFLGYPNQAHLKVGQALRMARKEGHPFTLAFALAFAAYLQQHLRNARKTKFLAQKTIEISSEHGFRHWRIQGTMLLGWALAELGQSEDGLMRIRDGFDAYLAMDSRLASPWFQALLAQTYARAGQPDAALHELDNALATARRTSEEFYQAELYRLRGEMLLEQTDDPIKAEAYYEDSLKVARKQNARSFELRTVVSLGRFLKANGRGDKAHELLAAIYESFGEGFDTVDLREARALLDELKQYCSA